jgi:hypothetical protein
MVGLCADSSTTNNTGLGAWMNDKKAKNLRKWAKAYAGDNWKRAYKQGKKLWKHLEATKRQK